MDLDNKYVFLFDLHEGKAISEGAANPTQVLQTEQRWLYAGNNKYDEDEIDSKKVGKWMIFPSKANVNATWNKIKKGTKDGRLWHSKVSTTDFLDPFHAIMIYTKDYTDLSDVKSVLHYIESYGIKPRNAILKYKTDELTRAGVYAGGKKKAFVYCSSTIRNLNENDS